MANRAKHVFGSIENVDAALQNGTIDQYDILFLKDKDGKPYIGWIDEDGSKVIVENSGTSAADEEIMEMLIYADMFPVVADNDNFILVD